MKNVLLIITILFTSVISYSQVDSSKFPREKIEFDEFTYFNDGSAEKRLHFYDIIEDSVENKIFWDKVKADEDSMYLKEFISRKPKFELGDIKIRKEKGVQILARLVGKTNKKYQAEIIINNNQKDTIDVDFSVRDSIKKDFTPILFHKIENLYSIMVTIFSKADNDSFGGYSYNDYYNRFHLVSIYPKDEINSIINFMQKNSLQGSYENYYLFDTLVNHNWNSDYSQNEMDTAMCYRYFQFDSVRKKYIVKRQYVTYPEFLRTTTDKEFLFWFTEIPKDIHYEYKIIPWEIYDDSHIAWIKNETGSSIIKVLFSNPGIFTLRVRHTNFPRKEFEYQIKVKPQWFQTLAFKITAASFITFSFLGILFIFYRRKQKRKLSLIQKQRAELDISLNSMRSQLNPHFIFNALNSIQGLISSTQYDKASEYLVDFSSLLRKPLNPEDIKHWTLSDEIELLNTYIKLEQLRAPFQYDMIKDDLLLTNQISFPALLLQPLVENAIKHGLPKAMAPVLRISFQKNEHDLQIIVKDNGNGFDFDKTYGGNGLKLSNEYIDLINKQFPESNTSINFESGETGTSVIISFQNWLDE